MPSNFSQLGALTGNVAIYNLTTNISRTPAEVTGDLRQLVANGVINGTLTLGTVIPEPAGQAQCAQLIARGWNCVGSYPIITQQPTFVLNVDGSYYLICAAHKTDGTSVTYSWEYFDGSDWQATGITTAQYDNPPFAGQELPGRAKYRCNVQNAGTALPSYTTEISVDVPYVVLSPAVSVAVGDPLVFDIQFSDDAGGIMLDLGYAPAGCDFQWYRDSVAQGNDVGRGNMSGSFGGISTPYLNELVTTVVAAEAGDQTGWALEVTMPSGLKVMSNTCTVSAP